VDRQPCSPSALVGAWEPIESEIPDYDLSSERYEFTSDGQFLWHFPHLPNASEVFRYTFNLDGFTLSYGKPGASQLSISAWFEGDVLVFEPKHGFKTRSRHRVMSEVA
jgi:hypothetical protein